MECTYVSRFTRVNIFDFLTWPSVPKFFMNSRCCHVFANRISAEFELRDLSKNCIPSGGQKKWRLHAWPPISIGGRAECFAAAYPMDLIYFQSIITCAVYLPEIMVVCLIHLFISLFIISYHCHSRNGLIKSFSSRD